MDGADDEQSGFVQLKPSVVPVDVSKVVAMSNGKIKTGQKIDEYEVKKVLGQGSFGVVHLVSHPRKGHFAMKFAEDEYSKNEYASWEAINDQPGVVKFHDAMHTTGATNLKPGMFYFMDLGSSSFENYLKDHPKMKEVEMRVWILQAVDILDQMHGKGVIHWDIKPENFLVAAKCSVFF